MSTENLTYIAFLIISFTPFYLINSELWMIGAHFVYLMVMDVIPS